MNDNKITRVDPLTFAAKSELVRVDLYANQVLEIYTIEIHICLTESFYVYQQLLPVFADASIPLIPTFYEDFTPTLFRVDGHLSDLHSV